MRRFWFSFSIGITMFVLYCIFTGTNPLDSSMWVGLSSNDVSEFKNIKSAISASQMSDLASMSAMMTSVLGG